MVLSDLQRESSRFRCFDHVPPLGELLYESLGNAGHLVLAYTLLRCSGVPADTEGLGEHVGRTPWCISLIVTTDVNRPRLSSALPTPSDKELARFQRPARGHAVAGRRNGWISG